MLLIAEFPSAMFPQLFFLIYLPSYQLSSPSTYFSILSPTPVKCIIHQKLSLKMFLLHFSTFFSSPLSTPCWNAKLILFPFSFPIPSHNVSTQSFLTAICWWHFIWKSDGKSCSARRFTARKHCFRQKWNFLKWQRMISKSLSRRWVSLY